MVRAPPSRHDEARTSHRKPAFRSRRTIALVRERRVHIRTRSVMHGVVCYSSDDPLPPPHSSHSSRVFRSLFAMPQHHRSRFYSVDDVHGCYQDVIAKMLQEQQRARASRSELLNAQTAHLAQIGDQWPAFQELQVCRRGAIYSRKFVESWERLRYCANPLRNLRRSSVRSVVP